MVPFLPQQVLQRAILRADCYVTMADGVLAQVAAASAAVACEGPCSDANRDLHFEPTRGALSDAHILVLWDTCE
ncbi:hypothetical protein C3Z06_14790 [Cupriavidus metallidurans]|nr:hypothetical protein C3Z06_14790 [Cupriavidus metallidurans]